MCRYLRLTNDFAFKYTFGNQDYPILMLTLLRALIPERKIESIEFLNIEPPVGDENLKKPRYDVKCKESDGSYFIVEMQFDDYTEYFDRLLIYSSDSLGKLLNKGEEYSNARPLYVISILGYLIRMDDDTPEERKQLVRRAHMHMDGSKIVLSYKLNFVFLQLPNAKQSNGNELTLENIAYLLGHMHYFENKPGDYHGDFYDILFSLSDKKNVSYSRLKT